MIVVSDWFSHTGLVQLSCPEHTPGQSPAFSGTGPEEPAVMSRPLQRRALNLQSKQNAKSGTNISKQKCIRNMLTYFIHKYVV